MGKPKRKTWENFEENLKHLRTTRKTCGIIKCEFETTDCIEADNRMNLQIELQCDMVLELSRQGQDLNWNVWLCMKRIGSGMLPKVLRRKLRF